MKKLRELSMAVVLALMLASGAFAGIIGTSPQPPPASVPEAIETPSSAQPVSATDPAMDLVLDLMQSVLSLL